MKLSEVKKICDGTFNKICKNLVDMVKKNKLCTGNKRLKGRDWTDMDIEKSNEIVDKIDKILKRKEHLRRLEEYVGGRTKTVNLCTFVMPMVGSLRKLLDEKHKNANLMRQPDLSCIFYITISVLLLLSYQASACSLSTLHFLKLLENKLESMKILENKLESMKILENKLESLKLLENKLKLMMILENKLESLKL
nr:hypothetical protein [Tanacetum cinerariifolium]